MNLSQQVEIQTSVHLCTFECYIRQANITMKFPCTYFVQWRTVNAKSLARSEKHAPQQSTVNFEERITLSVEMLYDHNKLEFLKRETIVELYLISKSRPDQNKLVGRVNVDLGKVINVGMYESPTEFKLNFCSIEGNLIMQFKAKEQRLTNLTVQDLDKSSFIDFISQNALKNQARNQSMILSRHENLSLERKSAEKVVRSEIRAPSLQAKESLAKSSFAAKSSLIKAEAEKLFASPSENLPNSPKGRISDEFQAKSKITTSNIRVKTQENAQTSFEQEQIVHDLKLNHVVSRQSNATKKEDPLPTQIITFQNITKKANDVLIQSSPSYNNQDFILNDIKEVQDEHLSQGKRYSQTEHEQVVAEKEKQIANIEAQGKKIKEEYYVLMTENAELKEERARGNERAKRLFDQFEEQRRFKEKAEEETVLLKAQLGQKDKTIQQLQRELQSKPSESESTKVKIATLQSENSQLIAQLQKQQAKTLQQTQQISSYQKILKGMEKENSECLAMIQSLKLAQSTQLKKLQSLELENNELVSHLQNVRRDYEQQSDHLKRSVDLEKHQQEIMQLEALVSRLEGELQQAVRRYETAQQQLTYLQGKYMELQSARQGQEQTSEVIEELADNVSEVVERVEKVVVVDDGELHRLRTQVASLNNEIQFLKENLEMSERVAKEAAEHKKEDIRAYEEKIASLQKEIASLVNTNNQIEEVIRSRDQLQRDNEALKREIEQLNRQLFQGEESNLAKMLQQENEQLREQNKLIQAQISIYEKELTALKEEMARTNQSKESPSERVAEYEQVVAKLSGNLEEQINQNNELSQAIVRYMEKEAKMKETLAVLEKESKQIFSLVQEKEQNEETYQKAIEELQCQLALLREGQGRTTEANNRNEQQSTDQSHNDELLKLQEKLLGENAELAAANNELREGNARLNEQLMQLSMEYNDFRQQFEQQQEQVNVLRVELRRQEELQAGKGKELERALKNKDLEVEIWKSRSGERQAEKQGYQQEIGRLRGCLQEIEEEKFNLQSSNNEKDIRILELQEELHNIMNTLQQPLPSVSVSTLAPSPLPSQLSLLSELRDKLLHKSLHSDWQSLLQSVLDRSMLGQDSSKLLNLEQKGRLLSKQLQKVKATLLKSDWRNHQQKIAAMGLFKKCESIVSELITSAESLNQNQSSFL